MNKAKRKSSKHGIGCFLIYLSVWMTCHLISRYFNLDINHCLLIIFCIGTILLSGYTVLKYRKMEISKRGDYVLANLIVAGMTLLLFLKAYWKNPEPGIIAIPILFAASLLLCTPSMISIPFFLLILLGKPINHKLRFIESPFDVKWVNKLASKFFPLMGLCISLFFMAAIIKIFWVGPNVIPHPWFMVAVVFYCSYWACLASVFDLIGNDASEKLIYQAFLDLYKTVFKAPAKKTEC